MFKEFRNNSWSDSAERDSYVRTLKSIRFHKSLDRLSAPSTTLIFISQFGDPAIRHHFEDSSRHFKTYNLFTDISLFFKMPTDLVAQGRLKMPFWLLNVLDFFIRFKIIDLCISSWLSKGLREHFSYRKKLRSLSEEEIVKELSLLFQMIGLKQCSKLNVIISLNEDRNIHFGIDFLCKALNNSRIKVLLSQNGILIPEEHLVCYGIFRRNENKLLLKMTSPILGATQSLVNYFEKKALWVMDRRRIKNLLNAPTMKKSPKTLIIGRRILTRGHDPLNENALIQSYDFSIDTESKLIQLVLKRFLESFKRSNTGAVIIIENYPNHISYLISKDDELKELIQGSEFALACVEPETKDIYTFEGDQFIQRSLKQIY